MNKPLQLGLIIEGNSTHSEVLRLPSLVQELGPVKSGSIRVARRQSNLIRAGYAVTDYEELQSTTLVLLKLADSSVSRVTNELCTSGLQLKGMNFVLCESWLPAKVLAPLETRGASVATILQIPSVETSWFIVEGETRAVKQMRRLLGRNKERSIELIPETKHLLFASHLLATTAPIALLSAARQLLRESGVSGKLVWSLLDQMGRKMLLDFSRSSRLEGSGPFAECPPETGQAHLDVLDRTLPTIAKQIRPYIRSVPEISRPPIEER